MWCAPGIFKTASHQPLCGHVSLLGAELWALVQVLISIPSLTDPALAPAGKHTLHAYLPATEPWEQWEGTPLVHTWCSEVCCFGNSACYNLSLALHGDSVKPVAGLERGTPEYEERKEQRSALLYRAVEKIIPDIRKRIEISMVRRGTVTY